MLKVVRNILIILLNIIFYGLVLFAGVQLCRTGYSFAYEVLGDTMVELPPGKEELFIVTADQDDFSLAEDLAEKNLVKNKYSFYIRLRLEKEDTSALKPGTYQLNSSMTYEEIIQALYQN